MKKDYIYLSIIALLIGIIIYLYSSRVPLSFFTDSIRSSKSEGSFVSPTKANWEDLSLDTSSLTGTLGTLINAEEAASIKDYKSLDEEEIRDLISSTFAYKRDVIKSLFSINKAIAAEAIDTDTISVKVGKKYIDLSLKARENNGIQPVSKTATKTVKDTTRAIYFTLPKLMAAILKNSGSDIFRIEDTTFMKTAMYVYFGKYSPDSESPNQSMAILQLVDKDNKAIENQIFNFGKLCPRKCPEGELLTN